jgi:hypothetical protein
MKHSRTSKARIGRSERATEALELRKAGLTFRQIGQRMGFSEQRAHTLVTEELARLNAKRAENATAVLRLELLRLDAMLAGVWKRATTGNLPAIGAVLGIMARRAKLLGLDAIGKPDIEDPPVTSITINCPALPEENPPRPAPVGRNGDMSLN